MHSPHKFSSTTWHSFCDRISFTIIQTYSRTCIHNEPAATHSQSHAYLWTRERVKNALQTVLHMNICIFARFLSGSSQCLYFQFECTRRGRLFLNGSLLFSFLSYIFLHIKLIRNLIKIKQKICKFFCCITKTHPEEARKFNMSIVFLKKKLLIRQKLNKSTRKCRYLKSWGLFYFCVTTNKFVENISQQKTKIYTKLEKGNKQRKSEFK